MCCHAKATLMSLQLLTGRSHTLLQLTKRLHGCLDFPILFLHFTQYLYDANVLYANLESENKRPQTLNRLKAATTTTAPPASASYHHLAH